MRMRLTVMAAGLLLLGCATAQGPRTFDSLKGPTTCPGPQCSVAVAPSCSGSNCGGKVEFDPINVTGRNVMITFNLPDGFGFCRQRGDGVVLKTETSDEFEPARENGEGPPCKSSFKLLDKNQRPRPDRPYDYKVTFTRLSDNRTYLIDPSFINR